VSVPSPIVEEIELDVVEVEIDFEKDHDGVAEIPQDIVNKVVDNLNEREGQGEGEPVEILSATFLQNLASDKMDLDLGEEYDDRVQEIVDELEESGREAGLNCSPSREIKKELIEEEILLRGNRKTGDRKVSSESTEEIERIIIDDSNEELHDKGGCARRQRRAGSSWRSADSCVRVDTLCGMREGREKGERQTSNCTKEKDVGAARTERSRNEGGR